jgi:hypothetical protein
VGAKHRRSEEERALASVGAPVNTVDFWPEAGRYGRANARPVALHSRTEPVYNGYSSNGYDSVAVQPDWVAAPEDPWQEWEELEDWGPPTALHPDHPSAPVPRIDFPADYPPRARQVPRSLGAPDGYQRRPGPGWQETTYYRRETGPLPAIGRYHDGRSQGADSLWSAEQVITLADGQAAQIAQDAHDYAAALREAAEREADAITLQASGRADAITAQATSQADAITQQAANQADVITQDATSKADAMTQQAASQAAAIREAAEREVAELRARIDSMSGELGRLAAYVTENLATPTMPASAPPLPDLRPIPPDTGSAPPATEPAMPDSRPARPDTGPGARPARPDTRPAGRPARPDTRPGTRTSRPDARPGSGPTRQATRPARQDTGPRPRPAGPQTTPADKPQKSGTGRQQRAARVATIGTAALLSIAAIGGLAEIGMHGFNFFVFREGGQGETPGNFHDTNFLARQSAASQHHDAAPKGRHHKATQGD